MTRMKTQTSRLFPVLVWLLMGTAWSAQAVDGVAEINQTCASVGCFTGDGGGFPVTISSAGSYRLTSNLIGFIKDTAFIEVNADDVTIDMNGFEIRCFDTGVTGAAPRACPAGVGNAIDAVGQANLTVYNGSILSAGKNGVVAGDGARVQGLHLIGNTAGIVAGAGSILSENVVTGHRSFGIVTDAESTISGNTVSFNLASGIEAGAGSRVAGNASFENGIDGIRTGRDCLVQGNTVHANTGVGLALAGGTGYVENSSNGNTAGAVSGGVNLGANVCNGVVCP